MAAILVVVVGEECQKDGAGKKCVARECGGSWPRWD